MNEAQHANKLELTILIKGIPTPKVYPANEKVIDVIRDLLPEKEKKDANDYQLVDRRIGTNALDPAKSLEENGVQNHDTLSFTKKDGGGGAV